MIFLKIIGGLIVWFITVLTISYGVRLGLESYFQGLERESSKK